MEQKNPIETLDLDDDPLAYAYHYAKELWFEQMCPARTQCFRCGVKSQLVYVPAGSIAFGDRSLLRRGDRDIAKDVVMAFAEIGWQFQKHKSYCPQCKGLGGI